MLCAVSVEVWGFRALRRTIATSDNYFFQNVFGPIVLFTMKRLCFLCLMVWFVNDHPNKHILAMPCIVKQIVRLNIFMILQVINAKELGNGMTFVIVDLFSQSQRLILCFGTGRSIAPRLFKFMLVKQLDNVFTPFPKHAAAVGPQNAIQTNMVFQSSLETFSAGLIYSLSFLGIYVIHFLILQEEIPTGILRLRHTSGMIGGVATLLYSAFTFLIWPRASHSCGRLWIDTVDKSYIFLQFAYMEGQSYYIHKTFVNDMKDTMITSGGSFWNLSMLHAHNSALIT